jgi:hypothetical protein
MRVLQIYYSINFSSRQFVVSRVICVLMSEMVWDMDPMGRKADPAALCCHVCFGHANATTPSKAKGMHRLI